MKKYLLVLMVVTTLFSCTKMSTDPIQDPLGIVRQHLLKTDVDNLMSGEITRSTIKETGQQLIRAPFKLKDGKQQIAVVLLNTDGTLATGKIIELSGTINSYKFNGTIQIWSLNRSEHNSSVIRDGFILSAHPTMVAVNSVRSTSERCSDCTIPEVIVSASYKYESPYNAADPFAWLNLFWLLGGDMPKMEYLPMGGGGGGSDVEASSSFDEEVAEKKEKVDPKKYTDCFTQVPDNGLTTYTVTISADIPKDGDPNTFFDWTTQFPGHAYIELSKSSPYGSVRQNLGFYPGTSWKVMTGHDIFSKVVDNGHHEYNARYTISVSATQFQAAINKLNTASSKAYNISYYNCTDFALDVFNAAGGNLTIPKHLIPSFGVPGGSNTPQGLYQKIDELKKNGVTGTTTTNNKEYAGDSKGPCE